MMLPSTAPYLWENYLGDGSDPASAETDSAFTTRPHKKGYGKRVAGNYFNGTFVQVVIRTGHQLNMPWQYLLQHPPFDML